MDLKVGLVCKLTGRIADFEGECESYNLDEVAVAKMNDDIEMEGSEITAKVSDQTLEKLKSEQSLPAAIFAGIFIGILAAIAWAAITVVTNMKIGLVAIAIGAAVGLGMRHFGKGLDPIYGICGAIIALISCFFGDILSIIGFVANNAQLGYFETLIRFDYTQIFSIMSEIASPMDLIFYAIAAWEGYKFSFRQFTQKDLYKLENEK
ncbi:hypothetical protein FBALC1_07098 [Flavobacteriales bacterium ALC-1]|nr:hypothetical protein FBALC1_07098 [Flavobacteriales bacterium ALC-1]